MWTDIFEKEPEVWQTVLVYPYDEDNPFVGIGIYSNLDEFWNDYDDKMIIDVDYWMPLPKAPENLQVHETIQEKVERSIQTNAKIWKELAGK